MADEPENLVLALLREIRVGLADVKAVQVEHTAALASIKETLALHGERLNTHSAMFTNIGDTLRELAERLRRQPSNAEVLEELRSLEARIEALEGRNKNQH